MYKHIRRYYELNIKSHLKVILEPKKSKKIKAQMYLT